MDDNLFWLIVIILIYICVKKHLNKRKERKEDVLTEGIYSTPSSIPLYHKEYIKKPLMTNYEQKFYDKLNYLSNEYLIVPQVNLASIIEKKSNIRFHTELFRNIDFGIFDKNTKEILLLIELNDKTHTYNIRKKRDKSVRNICAEAGIKLITFYTSYANETEYVINRIKKEINELNLNNKSVIVTKNL